LLFVPYLQIKAAMAWALEQQRAAQMQCDSLQQKYDADVGRLNSKVMREMLQVMALERTLGALQQQQEQQQQQQQQSSSWTDAVRGQITPAEAQQVAARCLFFAW
jgi:hypothetical protein